MKLPLVHSIIRPENKRIRDVAITSDDRGRRGEKRTARMGEEAVRYFVRFLRDEKCGKKEGKNEKKRRKKSNEKRREETRR